MDTTLQSPRVPYEIVFQTLSTLVEPLLRNLDDDTEYDTIKRAFFVNKAVWNEGNRLLRNLRVYVNLPNNASARWPLHNRCSNLVRDFVHLDLAIPTPVYHLVHGIRGVDVGQLFDLQAYLYSLARNATNMKSIRVQLCGEHLPKAVDFSSSNSQFSSIIVHKRATDGVALVLCLLRSLLALNVKKTITFMDTEYDICHDTRARTNATAGEDFETARHIVLSHGNGTCDRLHNRVRSYGSPAREIRDVLFDNALLATMKLEVAHIAKQPNCDEEELNVLREKILDEMTFRGMIEQMERGDHLLKLL